MRIEEFKQRLLETAAPAIQPPRLIEGDVIVTYKELPNEGIKYSRVHLRRLIAKGLFPAPRQLSPNRQGWGRQTDIEPWKRSRPTAPIAAALAPETAAA
jgi:predicted DNA-binding transcriptional regulator AlpA